MSRGVTKRINPDIVLSVLSTNVEETRPSEAEASRFRKKAVGQTGKIDGAAGYVLGKCTARRYEHSRVPFTSDYMVLQVLGISNETKVIQPLEILVSLWTVKKQSSQKGKTDIPKTVGL